MTLEIGDIVKITKGNGTGFVGEVDDFTERGALIVAVYSENNIVFLCKRESSLILVKRGE